MFLIRRAKSDPTVTFGFGRSIDDGRNVLQVDRSTASNVDDDLFQVGNVSNERSGFDVELSVLLLEASVSRRDVADLQSLRDLQRRRLVCGQSLSIQVDIDATRATTNHFHAVRVWDRLQFVLDFLGDPAQVR